MNITRSNTLPKAEKWVRYKYCLTNAIGEGGKHLAGCDEHIALSRRVATEGMVLLENNGILPLSPEKYAGKRIALVGALAGYDGKVHLLGGWSCLSDHNHTVSIEEGLKEALCDCEIVYSRGCGITSQPTDADTIFEAVKASLECDVIIAVVGEEAGMSGEANSRSDISLPGNQQKLIDALVETGKPVILLVASGRPLILTPCKDKVSAMMLIWQMGSSVGRAVADLITGAVSPSGHLTTSMPVSVGQIPIYYNHNNTGRPALGRWPFESKYRDCQIEPLYPFGYGISYTSFSFENVSVSDNKMAKDGSITVTLTARNTGEYDGAAVVQLYVRDLVGSCVRPVKELKGFEKVFLKAGESKEVTLTLSAVDMTFHNFGMEKMIESGKCKLWIGQSSDDESFEFDFEII